MAEIKAFKVVLILQVYAVYTKSFPFFGIPEIQVDPPVQFVLSSDIKWQRYRPTKLCSFCRFSLESWETVDFKIGAERGFSLRLISFQARHSFFDILKMGVLEILTKFVSSLNYSTYNLQFPKMVKFFKIKSFLVPVFSKDLKKCQKSRFSRFSGVVFGMK